MTKRSWIWLLVAGVVMSAAIGVGIGEVVARSAPTSFPTSGVGAR